MKKISSSFKISLLALSASIFTLSPLQAEEKKKALSHESEAAVVIQGGNSETQTYSVKQKTVYTMKPSEFTLTGGYLLGRAKVLPNGDLEKNAENWNAALRYDYYVNDRFSIWAQHGWEGDKFAGYHTRTNNDIGGKYYLWKKDKNAYFFTELGYRYTLENPLVGDDVDSHYVRAYAEASHQYSEAITFKLWVEALPDMTDTENFVLNFEPSLYVTLNKYFSLKTAFLGKYDTVPAVTGAEKFDYTYTLSLVAKY